MCIQAAHYTHSGADQNDIGAVCVRGLIAGRIAADAALCTSIVVAGELREGAARSGSSADAKPGKSSNEALALQAI